MKSHPSPMLALLLVISTSTITSSGVITATRAAQPPRKVALPAQRMETERFEKARVAFKKGRDLLLKEKLPFEPDRLLTKNWRTSLRESFNKIPELQDVRQAGRKLKGVYIAHTLYLPEKVELSGDTVILARNVLCEGSDVLIKGNYDFHSFAIDNFGLLGVPLQSLNESGVQYLRAGFKAGADSKILPPLFQGGRIRVDTHGRGRKEYLESRRAAATGGVSFRRARYALAQEDTHGESGADGVHGQSGTNGAPGANGSRGANGTCGGNVHGSAGGNGAVGGTGADGQNGGDGVAGKSGGAISFTITNINQDYWFDSYGGDGGRGGNGGTGGAGGDSGDGGSGGTGATCTCAQGGGGNGGPGGNGGVGGSGGKGGNGGRGGNAGNGGAITITHPASYDASRITSHAQAGTPGQGGSGGFSGNGGGGGSLGSGGLQGSSTLCPTSFPTLGGNGSDAGPCGRAARGACATSRPT